MKKVVVYKDKMITCPAWTNITEEDNINNIMFFHTGTKGVQVDWQGRILTKNLKLIMFLYAGHITASDSRLFDENPDFELFDVEFRDSADYEEFNKREMHLILRHYGIHLNWSDDGDLVMGLNHEQIKELAEKL